MMYQKKQKSLNIFPSSIPSRFKHNGEFSVLLLSLKIPEIQQFGFLVLAKILKGDRKISKCVLFMSFSEHVLWKIFFCCCNHFSNSNMLKTTYSYKPASNYLHAWPHLVKYCHIWRQKWIAIMKPTQLYLTNSVKFSIKLSIGENG